MPCRGLVATHYMIHAHIGQLIELPASMPASHGVFEMFLILLRMYTIPFSCDISLRHVDWGLQQYFGSEDDKCSLHMQTHACGGDEMEAFWSTIPVHAAI